MRGSSLGYLIRTGVKSVFRNRLMSFAAIGVLVACMILIGAAILFSMNINSIVEFTEEQNEIVVFCDDSLDDQALARVSDDLNATENVIDVVFFSREEAFEYMKERIGAENLFEELTADIYPDAYKVRVKNLGQLEETVAQIEGYDGVIQVNAPTDIADVVVEIKSTVYVAGIGIVAILAVVALVIIANTIKITVFNRRKEINIMKFVGATDSFIRLPFIIEGMMIGLLAAVFAFFIIWGAYDYLITWLEGNQSMLYRQFQDQIVPFNNIALEMLAAFAGAGVFIGVGGSMIFVRKYLRV